MSDLDTDVLVVGAGPTGLMLAVQLLRRGVRATVVDKQSGPSVATKALGVHARTLEIYAQLGLAERALERGHRASAAHLWARGRRAARVPLGDIGQDLSPFPFLLILGQDENEALLGEALAALGGAVRWDTELVGLAPDATGVTATLAHTGGARSNLRAAWIAGCDGPRSTVRRLLGIDFVGAPYEHVFFVADTRARGPMAPDELNVFLWRRGFHLFFPMRGRDHWRLVGILPAALAGRDDVSFDDVAPSVRAEVGDALAFEGCSWFSTYRIHHRRAARFAAGRGFLLGDAAHIHSPVGAQGMNTGLQDAYNLAWKLALVAGGRAHAELLDSYAAEREPVAERLLATTDRAFAFVVADGPLANLLRPWLLPQLVALAMRVPRARRFVFGTISQIGIRYPHSPLSRTDTRLPGGAPRAGDRFPWLGDGACADAGAARRGGPLVDPLAQRDDRRFALVAVGQAADGARAALGEHADLVETFAIPDDARHAAALARARIPAPSFFLLRPDGHVGLAGAVLDAGALRGYLAQALGTPRG